mmetsp:Transcript_15265/g.47291  ORF Transcript_15265/g.47291 Transcript_15265/m.47291 type:complete len:208 (+) Transcript_15265:355-978(+)
MSVPTMATRTRSAMMDSPASRRCTTGGAITSRTTTPKRSRLSRMSRWWATHVSSSAFIVSFDSPRTTRTPSTMSTSAPSTDAVRPTESGLVTSVRAMLTRSPRLRLATTATTPSSASSEPSAASRKADERRLTSGRRLDATTCPTVETSGPSLRARCRAKSTAIRADADALQFPGHLSLVTSVLSSITELSKVSRSRRSQCWHAYWK